MTDATPVYVDVDNSDKTKKVKVDEGNATIIEILRKIEENTRKV